MEDTMKAIAIMDSDMFTGKTKVVQYVLRDSAAMKQLQQFLGRMEAENMVMKTEEESDDPNG
jgi:hypothetical protein